MPTIAPQTYGHGGRSKIPTIACSCIARHLLTGHATISSSKLNLSTNLKSTSDSNETSSTKRFGSGALSSHGKNNPFNSIGPISTAAVASPTGSGASSAFGLGSGAFGFSSASKTPKSAAGGFEGGRPGTDKKDTFEDGTRDKTSVSHGASWSVRHAPSVAPTSSSSGLAMAGRDPAQPWPLRHTWIIYYRPPTGKHSDYEKSIRPLCRIATAQDFWKVYAHLRRPSALPPVSDYHFFREGIRPVWEDEENRRGGKWTMRVKKGVADRYWESLLLALIGDQFVEASEEVCGAVVSMRSGEDVFSLWTKNDGGRNIKIRETLKRELSLPADTNLQWRSHDESITQKHAVDQARQDKATLEKQQRGPLNSKIDSRTSLAEGGK